MARYEIADMNTGEVSAKQLKREAREAASLAKFLAECQSKEEAADQYYDYGTAPAVLDDIEF